MLIAAISDIHLPKNSQEFMKALDRLAYKPDLFLMAGDMVDNGQIEEYDRLYNMLFGKIFCPIVACFGNNEFQDSRDKVKHKYREIKFLDDESCVVETAGTTVGVFGSTGSLETPTAWQKANVPNIEQLYHRRVLLAEKKLAEMNTGFKILLTHYAPTFKTLEGSNPSFFSGLGSRAFENVIIKERPNLAVHGHAHRGVSHAWIDSIPVVNVAFPVNKGIVLIDTEKNKSGLSKFLPSEKIQQ